MRNCIRDGFANAQKVMGMIPTDFVEGRVRGSAISLLCLLFLKEYSNLQSRQKGTKWKQRDQLGASLGGMDADGSLSWCAGLHSGEKQTDLQVEPRGVADGLDGERKGKRRIKSNA